MKTQIIALIIAFVWSIPSMDTFAQTPTTEDLVLSAAPNEVLVQSDKFVKDEPIPNGTDVRLAVDAVLTVRNNPDTGRREIVIKLKTKASAAKFKGTFSGEKIVVLKSYPSDIKEVEIDAPGSHDHIFDFTEGDPDGRKQFGWTHPGFKPQPNDTNRNKLLINHVFYDGSRALKILLNDRIAVRVSVK